MSAQKRRPADDFEEHPHARMPDVRLMNAADPLPEYEALEKLAKRGIVPTEPATILALLAEIRRLQTLMSYLRDH